MNETVPPWVNNRLYFRPKVLDAVKGYTRGKFLTDLGAGLTVGIVALSLCIGLGIASGVTPAAGLYTGVIGGFLISALGGSRVQIGGPAGAFVGLIALLVAHYGFADVLLCTMMAGVILFAMGALRLGGLIKFVPHPVTVGFTCGIAITILSTQIRALLGLQLPGGEPAEFLPKMGALAAALPTSSWSTVALAAVSLAITLLWPKRWSRVPGSIVAVAVGVVVVQLYHRLGWSTDTIGSRFGGIPQGLPGFHLPAFNLEHLGDLIRPAFTIALLGAIESLLSAVVADGLIDDRHDSNQELMAQGVANFVAPLFGGLPATGVLARTATNIRSGAGTPVAGIVHAGFLLLVLVVAAPLFTDVPLAALAAVLAVVAVRMGEWEEFALLTKKPRGDAAVFLTTFGLTVLFDLTVAVEVGMVLAAFSFIKRVADTTKIHQLTGEEAAAGGQGHEPVADVPPRVMIYRVFGALLFGSAEKLESIIRRSGGDTRVVILHMAAVTAMDATALNRIENLHEKLRRHGKHLVLSGPHTQPYFLMEKAGFFDALGRDNIGADLVAAVARARQLVAVK